MRVQLQAKIEGQLFQGSTCGKGSQAFLYCKSWLYFYEGSSWAQRHGKNKQHYMTLRFSIRLFISLVLSRVHQEHRLYGSSPTVDTVIGFPNQGDRLVLHGSGLGIEPGYQHPHTNNGWDSTCHCP
ncbi:hypothetical protein VNO77_08041 [Canavalia gladiata]|uniref:Uncharacterized protein n=1 Tax=Canavalia gladiata TaxID=3824 RepID=A0AAN9M850_CANGL